MVERTVDVLVVGGGAAGMAAAAAVGRAAPSVMLCDEGPMLGGRAPVGVEIRLSTAVVDIDSDRRVIAYGPHGLERIVARAIVLAVGARDEAVLFEGWTLPGVMTADAMRVVAIPAGALAARRVVVVGVGTEARLAADQAARAGAGAVRLVTAGAIEAAFGSERVERVAIVGDEGEREELPAEVVVLAASRAPALEAAQLAGARFLYVAPLGGWVPVYGHDLQATVPGIFVAGGAAGVDAPAASELTGRIAGLGALATLDGGGDDGAIDRLWTSLAAHSTPERMAARALLQRAKTDSALATEGNTWSREGTATGSARAPVIRDRARGIEPWTVVCPCEDVTVAEVRECVEQGARSPDDVKRMTRCGMGACQWRVCRPLVAAEMSRALGVPLDAIPLPNVRFPLRPIPLGALAEGAGEQEGGIVRSVLSEVE